MLEKFQYINHMNESLDFGKGSLYVNENDLRDFSWEVTSKNDRISNFRKGITEKSIPIILKCDSEKEGIALRNKLFEVFEKDVLAVQHGKIIIGDYFMKCFVVKSQKSEYLINKGYMKVTVGVSTDFPYWVKETSTTFGMGKGNAGANLDFKRDFPSDYTSNLLGKNLQNTNFVPTNFRIRIYGACENPSVTIAGHEYKVNASIAVNEYLTIDSTGKTIILTHPDGLQTNCFNKRNRDSYIFEKIPVGSLNVSASGDFKFEVVLLEERGEPKWI